MLTKPQSPRPMPPEMAAWGTKHLIDDNLYKRIGNTLYQQYHDEDFADLLSQRQPAYPVASLPRAA